MAKKNFYAVKKGLTPGIYKSWDECKPMVCGFPGAIYKGFSTLDEAEAFLREDCNSQLTDDFITSQNADEVVAYVDGSFSSENEKYSCGVVILRNNQETYLSDSGNDSDAISMKNVAGEILGARIAMQYARDNGLKDITIIHDYQGISSWCTGEWKTKKEATKQYKAFYDDISTSVNIHFEKVKGHSGEFYNELADAIAKKELGIPIRKALELHLNQNN